MVKVIQKSETERAIELAVDHLRTAMQLIAGNIDIELYIQVRGVELLTLMDLAGNNKNLEIGTSNDCGLDCNKTNHYMNLSFHGTSVSLNTLNEI